MNIFLECVAVLVLEIVPAQNGAVFTDRRVCDPELDEVQSWSSLSFPLERIHLLDGASLSICPRLLEIDHHG